MVRPGVNHGPYGDIFDQFVENATDEGFHVLRFVTWENEEDIDAKTYSELQREAEVAIEFLRERGCEEVGIVAKSFGGGITLVGVPDGVFRLVLWAPAVSVTGEVDLDTEWDVRLIDLDGIGIDPGTLQETETPTLILHGEEDQLPLANSEDIVEELPDGELVTLEDGDHSFEGVEEKTIEHTVNYPTLLRSPDGSLVEEWGFDVDSRSGHQTVARRSTVSPSKRFRC